ncbi:MAG: magnesium transporter [Deinococcus-Thermus bacterium]|jgi:magnesium transporter|nr:magnesium transporter [Deinococcota bacterium]
MLTTYEIADGRLRASGDAAPEGAVWIDLFAPTRPEEQAVEAVVGTGLPTREDMEEIEHSSRLYAADGAHFMTATLPARADGDDPDMRPVTFVLAGPRLVTIRYHDPQAFRLVPARAEKTALPCASADEVLMILLEAVVDREADILERAGREIDAISRQVFRHADGSPTRAHDFRATLGQIGRKGDLVSDIRESLATYLAAAVRRRGTEADLADRNRTLARDVRSLSGHAGFLEQKIAFLLDATLGLISTQQNAIIKVFSVAAVAFLPPTLIASIYGMNFAHMPELGWRAAYPVTLGLMVLSAILPLAYFKRRGWL